MTSKSASDTSLERRRLYVLLGGAVGQSTGFFVLSALLRPSEAATASIVGVWAALVSGFFAATGFVLALVLRKDVKRLEVAVGAAFGLVLPGLVGWIIVGSLPEFSHEPFWRLLIVLIGGMAGATFWSVLFGYLGGRWAEKLLRMDAA